MTTSNATISTEMNSFLKRSKKKRVSRATSREEGGAVGINYMCSAGSNRASGSSYATRWFLAQAVLRSTRTRPGFLRRYNLIYECTLELFSNFACLNGGTKRPNICSNLPARHHRVSCHIGHGPAWAQTLPFAQDTVRRRF